MKHILAFIDAPDPDNFVLIIAATRLFPEAELHVILTGRPVRFNVLKASPVALWDWDITSSQLAHQASAMRIKNFLRHFGITVVKVYDGGIAPRTLVPHHIHFADYYRFQDVDPLAAIRHSELEPQEDLIRLLLTLDECHVVVGGPMTGLAQMLIRHPEIATKIKEVHAMFATWGRIQLMQMGDTPRGAVQFNVACDPQSAYQVLMGLPCPIYLMPSEVTRVDEIGFDDAATLRNALPQNNATTQLYMLYALWYDAAVKPRNEKIYIHDVVAALSLHPTYRSLIYDVVPIEITAVPHLPSESADWGKVVMREAPSTNRFAARGLTHNGAKDYLRILHDIFI